MLHYVLKKILYGFLVLVGVVVVVFFLFNVLPGDPARMTLGVRSDPEAIALVRKELGLDKPLHVQFFMYLNDLSFISIHEHTPDNEQKYGYVALFSVANKAVVLKLPYLRRSYQTRRKVAEILGEALPKTMLLAFTSIFLATFLGIFLGVIAAIHQNKFIDHLTITGSVIGISVPSFLSGIIISYFFGLVLSDYTGLEMTGGMYEYDSMAEKSLALRNLILPTIALGIRPLAVIVQLTRSAMLDVLSQDYIRTAVAKGLKYRIVLYKHALRNALNPVVTAISGWFAAMLAGAFFIEWVFDWKGLGYQAVTALQSYDFPVVMGTVLITALVFVIINILVDIIYGILDPRVSFKK